VFLRGTGCDSHATGPDCGLTHAEPFPNEHLTDPNSGRDVCESFCSAGGSDENPHGVDWHAD